MKFRDQVRTLVRTEDSAKVRTKVKLLDSKTFYSQTQTFLKVLKMIYNTRTKDAVMKTFYWTLRQSRKFKVINTVN